MPETFIPFMQANGICHRHILMEGTKKQTIPIKTMVSILEVIHNKENHPVLIHCNQGKVCLMAPLPPGHFLQYLPIQ